MRVWRQAHRAMSQSPQSFPERNADYERFEVHYELILNLSLPRLVINVGNLREPEAPQHPAERHAHLHQRQVLADATCRAIREGYERGHVVFSCWHIGVALAAAPSLRQECFGIVKVPWVTMDAERVKADLCLLWHDPARGSREGVRM
jgi:hypothetical protein